MGNGLAIVFNYLLGYLGGHRVLRKIQATRSGEKTLPLIRRSGILATFLSWLPWIGDPLTVLAGVLRMNPIFFLSVAVTLRILRYAVLLYPRFFLTG